MAKTRGVNTRFWNDNFVREKLNPLDRYLFLYFLTNDHVNISGIYELPLSTMSFETGIKEDELKTMLKTLKPKILYIDRWVCIKNFLKYQKTSSEKIQIGIRAELDKIPAEIKKKFGAEHPNLRKEVDELAKKMSVRSG